MEIDSARSSLHDTLQSAMPFDTSHDEDLPDSGVVTGWVLVAEWQGSDGERWLSKISGDASGERALPAWTSRGLCAEVVHNWPDVEA